MHFCSFVDYRPTCGDEPTHPPPALCRGGGEVCYRRPCSRSSCSAFVLVILRSPEDCDLRSVAIFVSVYLSVRTPLAYLNKSSAVAEMGDRGHSTCTWAEKRGCCAPFAGAGTSSSIMWPGPRSTSVPSGVFIRPAIWPQ